MRKKWTRVFIFIFCTDSSSSSFQEYTTKVDFFSLQVSLIVLVLPFYDTINFAVYPLHHFDGKVMMGAKIWADIVLAETVRALVGERGSRGVD